MAAAPIIYQRAAIGPKVLDQLTDVLFARERAARTADMRGAEPARQFRQAPEAGTRTTVPKQPLGALEIANRIAAKVASRRVRESWLRESEQSVEWIFCLTAARVLVANQEQR